MVMMAVTVKSSSSIQTAALDQSHKAVSSAMDKHRPAIPLPIVRDI